MADQEKTAAGHSGTTPLADAADIEDWRAPLTPAQRASVTARVDALRDEIDRCDEQLVRLLSARANCALEIGRLKKLLLLEIYQPKREEAVLRHVREVNTGPLDGDAIARLFERIIDEARRLERQEKDKEGGQA
jgi:chorismate mutase